MKSQSVSSALLVAPSKIATVSEYAEEEAEYFGIKIKNACLEVPTFDSAEQFVDKLLQQGIFDNDPIVQSELRNLNNSATTLRSIQRRFSRSTGISRSHFQRINQAAHAETLLLQDDPIADVTYQAGYYDQSHLIRSLKALRGFTPSEIRGSLRR